MKKLLLTSILMLGSLSSFAQDDCATPLIATAGTNTAPAIGGTYEGACYDLPTDNAGGPILGLWYTYTPVSDGEVTINSNLPANVAPNSDDTMVSVMTGTCGTLTCVAANDDISATNYLSTVTFPVAAGVTYYIQWSNYWNGAGFDFNLTFNPISCLGVYTVNAPTNETTTSLTLNWVASLSAPAGYEVEYGPSGFVQGAGTTVTTPTNSVGITGLTASTVYDFYVRSNCGATQSTWTTANKATTAKVLPYTTSFDTSDQLVGWTTVTNGPGGQQAQPLVPAGTAGQGSTPGYWIFGSSTTAGTPNNNWLFSAPISLQANEQVTVSFYTRVSTFSRTLRVTVGTDNTVAAQTTQLAALTLAPGTTWVLNTIPAWTAPAAGVYYFGFNDNSASTATAQNMRLDSFSFTSVLGTNDFLSSKFSVYPNPASNVINIANEDALISSVDMTDMNGRVVKSTKFNATQAEVSIADLATGIYMMKITTDQGVAIKKVIKE